MWVVHLGGTNSLGVTLHTMATCLAGQLAGHVLGDNRNQVLSLVSVIGTPGRGLSATAVMGNGIPGKSR